jgi:hypothetical protein
MTLPTSVTRPGLSVASIAAGALLGGVVGLIATMLVANYAAVREASSASWALGLAILYYLGVPAVTIGAVAGGTVAQRRARRRQAAAPGTEARTRWNPIAVLAALCFGAQTAVFLGPFASLGGQMLRVYLDVVPMVRAAVVLLVHLASLIVAWYVGRGAGRLVNDAVSARAGRSRLPDIAILAILVGLFGTIEAMLGVDLLIEAPALQERVPHVRWYAAESLAIAALCASAAYALLRQRRAWAISLLGALGALIVGRDVARYVLAPASEPAASLPDLRVTVVVVVVVVGILLHLRRRLER